jgi:hypothetical protein
LVAVQSNIHPGPNLPGQVTMADSKITVIDPWYRASLPN